LSNNQNRNFAFALIAAALGMIFLSFASVPLYNIFCKVTGYGGTVAENSTKIYSEKKGTRTIKVTFDANVDDNLPWKFVPMQKEIEIKNGDNALIFYIAENLSNEDIVGTAVYNVTPHQAGIYFNKIQCFCFEEQLLKAGQKMQMPVSFFIDPEIENDPETRNIKTITLSYRFMRVK